MLWLLRNFHYTFNEITRYHIINETEQIHFFFHDLEILKNLSRGGILQLRWGNKLQGILLDL